LVLRWTDPATGKPREQTAGTSKHRDAERRAGLLAEDIEAGVVHGRIAWRTFRHRYESEKFAVSRPKSLAAWKTAANQLESICDPPGLEHVDSALLSQFAAKLHAAGKSPATIAAYLREIRTAVNWAAHIFPGYQPPRVKLPRIGKRQLSRGRPITMEEFERMLKKTKKVVGEKYRNSWRWLMRGLFLSGLRLGEALRLTWDDPDGLHVHGIDRRRPMLCIHVEDEKGKQDRLLPITPDFADLLRLVPAIRRTGHVFNPRLTKGRVRSTSTASRIISAIGKKTGVKVSTRRKRDENGEIITVPKFASAQDFRRTFGSRWAPKVMPIILKELMRHESIETTLNYYVGLNAERTANEAWSAFESQTGAQIGDTPQQGARTNGKQKRSKS
jgi:integrase